MRKPISVSSSKNCSRILPFFKIYFDKKTCSSTVSKSHYQQLGHCAMSVEEAIEVEERRKQGENLNKQMKLGRCVLQLQLQLSVERKQCSEFRIFSKISSLCVTNSSVSVEFSTFHVSFSL